MMHPSNEMTRQHAIQCAFDAFADEFACSPHVADGFVGWGKGNGFARLPPSPANLDAQVALFAMISALSERCYCARWLIGAGDICRALAAEGGGSWGLGEVSAEEAAILCTLAEAAGGWWTDWNDETVWDAFDGGEV